LQYLRVCAIFLTAIFVLAACSSPAPEPTSAPVSEPTSVPAPEPTSVPAPEPTILRIATSADNKTLDPAMLTTNPDIWVDGTIYDKLLERNLDMTLTPSLATSWEPTDDLSSYTFHLRPGVQFQSGKDLTSEDVVFTFERLLDPEVGSPASSVLSTITNIEAVDPLTVRFDLSTPSAFFPDLLTAYQAKIINSQVDTQTLALTADGTGPFILEEYKSGERAVLKRNPNYWGEGPFVDQVVFYFMPSPQSRVEALKTGAVDIVYPLAPTAIADLEKASSVRVSRVSSSSYLILSMDTNQAPFDNPKVRQAVQAATDREAINKASLLGLGTVGSDIAISPNDPNFPLGVKPVAYDPARAKQLLTEAGYPDGIDITLHTSDVFPGLVEMAVTLKETAAPAGIRIAISRDPEETFWSKVWLTEPFVTVNWFGRDADSALAINVLSDAPWNESNYRSQEVDDLVLKARGQTDIAARRETYGELQKLLVENAGRIIPVFMPVFMGLRDNVEGVSAHPTNFLLLEAARVK